MTRRTIALLFVVITLAALPAAAFTPQAECYGYGVRWNPNYILMYFSRSSFPAGSAWERSVEAAARGWNSQQHATDWSFDYVFDPRAVGAFDDHFNDLVIAKPDKWAWPGYVSVSRLRYNCWQIPYGDYEEADILLSPHETFDLSTSPQPSSSTLNATLVMLHEHGHVLGLGHEDDVLATMNSGGMHGGPIGTRNEVLPHPDDVRGARELYGKYAGAAHDVAASAMHLVSPGVGRPIYAPGSTDRNTAISFPFTVLNRGAKTETVPVSFYLSETRTVDPASRYLLGSTTLSLPFGGSTTGFATVFLPPNAPTGHYYVSWVTDPNNVIAEDNETNNAVALIAQTYVGLNRAPTPCASATPSSGYSPLRVTFDARCSSDPDGDSLTYTWDFGDGYTVTGPTTTRTYLAAGTYTVYVYVKDANGATSSSYQTIFVRCPSGMTCGEEPE